VIRLTFDLAAHTSLFSLEGLLKKLYAFTLGIGLAIAFAAPHLRADTITTVDLSTACGGSCYNGSWSSELNGPAIQTGAESGTGNTGSGLTFNDPTGQFDEVGWDTAQTFNVNVALTSNSAVDSLMNMFYGNATPGFTEATVTMTNSLGATETYDLDSQDTIRDYNDDGFANGQSGSNPPNAGGTVTAQAWWSTLDGGSNADGQPSQRLDAQTFVLPASWAGTNLTSIEVSVGYDGSFPVGDVAVSGFDVTNIGSSTSPVPEPSSISFLMVGLLGAALLFRRHRGSLAK
jgi:hypothetical protein